MTRDHTHPTPTRLCDLVMKGGITSGVVYPLAVVELAKAFRFKNIGGTSAAAIAAAAAAAAEYRRHNGDPSGFDRLAELPAFLGEAPPGLTGTYLRHFFQPQRRTMKVFDTAVAGLGGEMGAWRRVVMQAVVSFWPFAIIGAIPGALVMWVGLNAPAPWPSAPLALVLLGAVIAVVGALLAVAGRLAITALKAIPENLFGLTTGMPGAGREPAPALTPWITEYLNELAGLKPDGQPLTFGDLWHCGPKDGQPTVNLQMMTTCLSHGRPYRLPFGDDDTVAESRQFYFRQDDLKRLFPDSVVRWLVAHPRQLSQDPDVAAEEERFRERGFLPLPDPADLPVALAVRMSISFPILLSAVPLYAVDRSRVAPEDRRPERCWFSDGGISSNFPIHLFDSALPRWPTFGIDLVDKHPDHPAGVYLPKTNFGSTLVKWTRFDKTPGLGRLFAFVATIVFTAKDWTDNAQCRLPGFRDRIAQVSLAANDGGLNLNMPAEAITRLSEFGRRAGREFVRRFASDDPGCRLDWANHRHVRLRSALAAIEEWLVKLERACAEPQTGDRPYPDLIADADPPSYDWANRVQQRAAADQLDRLRDAARRLKALTASQALRDGSPKPRPELRVRPRI